MYVYVYPKGYIHVHSNVQTKFTYKINYEN